MFAWGDPLQIKRGKASRKNNKQKLPQPGERDSVLKPRQGATLPHRHVPGLSSCLYYVLPLPSFKGWKGKLELTACFIQPCHACGSCPEGSTEHIRSSHLPRMVCAWLLQSRDTSVLQQHFAVLG